MLYDIDRITTCEDSCRSTYIYQHNRLWSLPFMSARSHLICEQYGQSPALSTQESPIDLGPQLIPNISSRWCGGGSASYHR